MRIACVEFTFPKIYFSRILISNLQIGHILSKIFLSCAKSVSLEFIEKYIIIDPAFPVSSGAIKLSKRADSINV